MEPPREPRAPERYEMVAGTVMGASVIFLLLQVPVMVAFLLVAVLLPGLGILAPSLGEPFGIGVALFSEAILLFLLVRMVRRSTTPPQARTDPAPESASLELRLERLMITAAVTGVVASLMMGLGPPGAKVAATVIDAFAALFLLIAVVTRWLMTRRVSAWGLIALGATLYSLCLATGLVRT